MTLDGANAEGEKTKGNHQPMPETWLLKEQSNYKENVRVVPMWQCEPGTTGDHRSEQARF